MTAPVCVTCGTQFAEADTPPAASPICEDPRQYVPQDGQRWTTLRRLRHTHHTEVRADGELEGIGMSPSFAIGQRALLVPHGARRLMWDCIPLLDDEIAAAVEMRGGLAAIAISHPHFYSSFAEWSRAFGDVPVYLHALDREWVMRDDANVVFWAADSQQLPGGVTLIRCGGHFEGGTVLHWPAGADGRGALLASDIITVVPDRRYVSFMRSYPNLIPLSPRAIEGIAAAVEPLAFDRIYGGWYERVVEHDAKAAVRRSAERYLRAIQA